ncbi:MAG: glycosyltransferase [Lachnospiraceae bacterium]|nr:glycosyltransferase [Lachnospiraceae bacterium]
MKILVVNDILQGGGVEKLMYDFVTYYKDKYDITILTDKRDFDFENVYPPEVGYLYQMEKDYPVSNHFLKRRIIKKIREQREKKLKNKIRSMNFDVLLCMKESWIMMMAMTYGDYIPKRFAWVHTDYTKSYYTKHWFNTADYEVEFMRRFNNVVCVSKVIEESIKKVIGDPGNLLVRYNPVNKEDIINKSMEEVSDIKRSKRPLFVTVGRLNIQKGYDILLEVCNLLNSEGLQYDVWIIGGGESWNNYEVLHELEDKIREFNLKNVYLLGERKNPYKYISQADWFLSTSRYEGYSYVSQEACILKKPLMLTACSGVMELLGSEENGMIMENSYKGIYLGMKSAIEDPDLKEKYMGKLIPESAKCYWNDRLETIEKLFS